MQKVDVVCVNWGTKYGYEYVERLYRMVKKNTTFDFQMYCLTDNPKLYSGNIKGIRLKPGLVGWWNKLQLFEKNVLPDGEYLYFDLDVVIVDNIDCLFNYSGFGITRDFINPDDGLAGGKEYNSSVMRFTQIQKLVDHFNKSKENWLTIQERIPFFGDQNVISDYLNNTGFDRPFPDEWIWSYKMGTVRGRRPIDHTKCFGSNIPKYGKVCVFHGRPNPDEVEEPWVKENWLSENIERPKLNLNNEQDFTKNKSEKEKLKIKNLKNDNLSFVIISPIKNLKSAGSKFLYELSDDISRLGMRASRVVIGQKDNIFYISLDEENFIELKENTLNQFFDAENTVIIHGENLHHKYFDDFQVARFYLNRIGAMKNLGVPRDGEFKIAWDKIFVKGSDFILNKPMYKIPSHEVINFEQPRSLDLTYLGKATSNGTIKRLPGTIELTRNWPSDNDEYLFLLSRTRFLFSFDPVTAVLQDAIRYGALPVLMTHHPLQDWKEVEELCSYWFDCVLPITEFNKINSENIERLVHDFKINREKVLKLSENKLKEYESNLQNLIENIDLFFS